MEYNFHFKNLSHFSRWALHHPFFYLNFDSIPSISCSLSHWIMLILPQNIHRILFLLSFPPSLCRTSSVFGHLDSILTCYSHLHPWPFLSFFILTVRISLKNKITLLPTFSILKTLHFLEWLFSPGYAYWTFSSLMPETQGPLAWHSSPNWVLAILHHSTLDIFLIFFTIATIYFYICVLIIWLLP